MYAIIFRLQPIILSYLPQSNVYSHQNNLINRFYIVIQIKTKQIHNSLHSINIQTISSTKIKKSGLISTQKLMQTFQQSPQLYSSHFQGYRQNAHLQNMKKSSKSVSRYLQSSSMLYSPNKRFVDDTIKNQLNTMNSQCQKNEETLAGNIKNSETQEGKVTSGNLQLRQKSVDSGMGLGRVVVKLETRLDGVQVKIASLTNIVKLLQKYSETKDDQYEKQKQNLLFAKTTNERVQQIQSLELQNKIKEFNLLSKQMKKQIEEVTELKHKLQSNLSSSHNREVPQFTNNEIKKFTSNKSKKFESKSPPQSQASYLDVEDLATAFQEMEQRLREEINKKMEICLRQIKKVGSSVGGNDVSGIDQNLFEQQINALNFAINKVENECTRNKMILENQIQQIQSRLPGIYHSASNQYFPRNLSHFGDSVKVKAVRDKSGEKSTKRSHSRRKSEQRSISKDQRQKSRSKLKSNNESEKLLDKKKVKQEQLQQAIRRKKQLKQKLKANNLK